MPRICYPTNVNDLNGSFHDTILLLTSNKIGNIDLLDTAKRFKDVFVLGDKKDKENILYFNRRSKVIENVNILGCKFLPNKNKDIETIRFLEKNHLLKDNPEFGTRTGDIKWLKENMKPYMTNIIFTDYIPSEQIFLHDNYLVHGFHDPDISYLTELADVWIWGNSHTYHCLRVNRCRFYTNQWKGNTDLFLTA